MEKTLFSAIAAGLLALPVTSRTMAVEPTDTAAVPAGFEDLLAPQESIVDIYFGGQLLISLPAIFTLDTVEFTDPDLLVEQIPGLLNAKKVRQALVGALDSHSEALCQSERDDGCGIIEPGIAGIIFDESRFRADLFVHPDYLAVAPVQYDRYLPDSTAGLGLMQNLSATISGDFNSDNSDENYTIFGSTFLSMAENNLQMNWDISRDQNVSINQLLAERDYRGKQWQAGLVYGSGFGLSFSGSSRIWGARMASSFNTRVDRSFTQGTPLDIFMPVKGRYEIFYENRLIGSAFVDAGNQALDTSRFPGGAYDLTIRLLDEQGNLIREEQRFFAKQTRLPPVNASEYFIEAGHVAETVEDRILPDMSATWIARAGVNMRLANTWASTLALATTPGQTLGEASFFNLGRRYDLAGSLMFGGAEDYGVRVDANYRLDDLTLSGSYLQLWRDTTETNTVDSTEFDLLGNAFAQSSFSASYPLFDGSASYRYSQNGNRNSDGLDSRETRQSVSYSRSVYQGNWYSASVNVETSWSDDDGLTGLVSIELSHSRDNWSFRALPQSNYSRDSDGDSTTVNSLRVGANYDDNDTFAGRLNGSLSAEKSSGRTSASLSTRYGSSWGSTNVNLNHVDSGGVRNTSYAASLSTSLTVNQDVVAFGGDSLSRSAVVVTVEGAHRDEQFDVYVDGQRRGYALGGKPSIVHLSPFSTYNVGIRSQQGGSLFSLDEKEYKVTLYPGNITALDYDVKQVLLVYGRVHLPDGQWLTNASVLGGEGLAVSDEFGLFQAEISTNTEELVFRKKGQECSLPLSPDNFQGDFINLGKVACIR